MSGPVPAPLAVVAAMDDEPRRVLPLPDAPAVEMEGAAATQAVVVAAVAAVAVAALAGAE